MKVDEWIAMKAVLERYFLLLSGKKAMTGDLKIKKANFEAILGVGLPEPLTGYDSAFIKLYEPTTQTWTVMMHDAGYPFEFYIKKNGDAGRYPLYYEYASDTLYSESNVDFSDVLCNTLTPRGSEIMVLGQMRMDNQQRFNAGLGTIRLPPNRMTSPQTGDCRYDAVTDTFEIFNGVDWKVH